MIICQYVNNETEQEYLVFVDFESFEEINPDDYARPGFTLLGAAEGYFDTVMGRGVSVAEEDCYLLDR